MVDRKEKQVAEGGIFFFCFLHPIFPFFKFEFCERKINNFDDFAVQKFTLLNRVEKGVGFGLITGRS